MSVLKNNFETSLVKKLNTYFKKMQIVGHAYRIKQAKFAKQYGDIIVDSKEEKYYALIECKNLKSRNFYFRTHYRLSQIEDFSDFLLKTGRSGHLAIRLESKIYLMPWKDVLNFIHQNKKSIPFEHFNNYLLEDWLNLSP